MSDFDALTASAEVKSTKTIKSFVRDFIDERIAAVNANPDLRIEDRKTLSTCFYMIRPKLLTAGFEFSRSTRKTIQVDYIQEVCKERGHKRAQLGIIAADRAEFYYAGRLYNVGPDAASSELADWATDVLIIEKEGVVEALGPYADKYGIALMYTRGFAVEYAEELSESTGANVAILTDYDPAGVIMGHDLGEIPRIGIDFETLAYFYKVNPDALTADSEIVRKLQEIYPAALREGRETDTHLISLENDGNPAVRYFKVPNENKRRRIEIDSVLKDVGNRRFFSFIVHKLKQLFPTRDYTRVIDLYDEANIEPKELSDLNHITELKVRKALRPSISEYENHLSEYEGFIKNIDKEKQEINSDFSSQLDNNVDLQAFLEYVRSLVEKYRDKREPVTSEDDSHSEDEDIAVPD